MALSKEEYLKIKELYEKKDIENTQLTIRLASMESQLRMLTTSSATPGKKEFVHFEVNTPEPTNQSKNEPQNIPMEELVQNCVKKELEAMEERLINLVNMAKDQGRASASADASTDPWQASAAANHASASAGRDCGVKSETPVEPEPPQAAMATAGHTLEGMSLAAAPLTPLDSKAFKKPGEYAGDVKLYFDWREQFVNFLAAKDVRWRKVMEGIESKGFTEITLEDEVAIAQQAGLAGQLLSLKTQLYAYLQSYTKGSVTDLVTAGQEDRVFEVFRQIADKGRSRRP